MSESASKLDIDLEMRVGRGQGQFVVEARFATHAPVTVLFGPSGAGKTLTLRAIAGLLRPEKGHVRLGETLLFDAARGVNMPAEERRMGYVPQDQALFPHLNVLENVVFGLPREERKKPGDEVLACLDELGLSRLQQRPVTRLSGGEKQRVALCRALVARPRMLLLDEPFSALDRAARQDLGGKLKDVLEKHGVAAVLVTHDAEEAASLGDTFVRFERGKGISTQSREMLHG